MMLYRPALHLRPITWGLIYESVDLVRQELVDAEWMGGKLIVYDELESSEKVVSALGNIWSDHAA